MTDESEDEVSGEARGEAREIELRQMRLLSVLCDGQGDLWPEVAEALDWAVSFCLPPGMKNGIWLKRGKVFRLIVEAGSHRWIGESPNERAAAVSAGDKEEENGCQS